MGLFDFLSGDASVDASVSAGASADAGAGGTATAVDGDNIASSGNGGDGSDAAGGGDGGADTSAGGLLQISSTPVSFGPLLPFDTTGSGQPGTVNPWAAPRADSHLRLLPSWGRRRSGWDRRLPRRLLRSSASPLPRSRSGGSCHPSAVSAGAVSVSRRSAKRT